MEMVKVGRDVLFCANTVCVLLHTIAVAPQTHLHVNALSEWKRVHFHAYTHNFCRPQTNHTRQHTKIAQTGEAEFSVHASRRCATNTDKCVALHTHDTHVVSLWLQLTQSAPSIFRTNARERASQHQHFSRGKQTEKITTFTLRATVVFRASHIRPYHHLHIRVLWVLSRMQHRSTRHCD